MILYKNKKLVIPTGINPHYLEDSSVINNQDKEITITRNGKTTLVHEPGFSGLGIVKINTYVGEQSIQPFYSTTITDNGDYDIFPDEGYDAIAEIEVTVNVQPELQDKTVDSSTNEQVITHDSSAYGLSSVTINPYVLDEKTVDSSTREQVITSDVDGLKSVTVTPYVLTSLELDSSTNEQRATGQFGSVKINPYTLDEKTVDSSTNPQVITSNEDGIRQVTINPYVLSPLEVDSSTAMQEISGQYGTVTVNPYTLDEKTVDSSTKEQTITSDADGLSKVTINPYVLSPLKVDSSTAIQEITGQFGTVTVNPYTLQYKAKELEPSFRNEDVRGAVVKVEPDDGYDGLSAFQYRLPSILTSKTFDASTGNQTYVTNTANTYVKGINEIVINGLDLDSCYNLAASI